MDFSRGAVREKGWPMSVKIIKGIYGYKDAKGTITPMTSKDGAFRLTDEQEARLVSKGVAVYVNSESEKVQQEKTQKNKKVAPVQQQEEKYDGNLDKEQLMDMGYNDLKHLAKQLGISAEGKKDELVERIAAVEVNATGEEVEEDDDDEDEEPPTLSPADPE